MVNSHHFKLGLKSLKNSAPTVIQLVDVLDVKSSTIKILNEVCDPKPHFDAIIPTFQNKGGHPIILMPNLIEKTILQNDGSRLDQILKNSNLFKIPVNDKNILKNQNIPLS